MANTNPKKDDFQTEDFSRTIAGAYVTFEDGARVSSIRLPGDFSAVHLSGLPLGSSPTTVKAFLAENGFEISENDIWVIRQDEMTTATVRAKGPDFFKKFRALMQAGLRWGSSQIRATPVAARIPSGNTLGHIDCKKVHVSWHKAMRTACLSFGSRDIAIRVGEKFTTGSYTTLGQKIRAERLSKAESRSYGSHYSLNWYLMLTQVPASARKSAIFRAISQMAERPSYIELDDPGYDVDDEKAAIMVHSLLTDIGPVEHWETTLGSTPDRIKATARFLDPMSAREAVSRLNEKPLPFHKNGKLTVQMVYSAKFKVRSDVYKAIVSGVRSFDAWKQKHIFFRTYSSTKMLKIEGKSISEVVNAKAALSSIIDGVVAKNGEENLWDDSLKHNGELWRLVKEHQEPLGVVVVRNQAKKELRLFGTESKCNNAQKRLADLLFTRVIELDSISFRWACRGGLKSLVSKLGPKKASLDVISSPKSIIISGSLDDYNLALTIIPGGGLSQQPKSQTAPGATKAEGCSICWTEVDAHIRTNCGHLYCQGCFENACQVTPTPGTEFVLLCRGDQGNCSAAITMQDLHDNLSPSVFDEVLKRSFRSSVQRAPDELRFCPTPDCGSVYRVTESVQTYNCTNCLQPTCSACQEPHLKMTCAEYNDFRSGGSAAFENLMKEVGLKDCPKCKTPIEKMEGGWHVMLIHVGYV